MGNVKYSKGGHWQPTIPGCICEHCKKTYTAHKYGSKYCSKSCSSIAQTERRFAGTRTDRDCPGCGKKWSGPPSNKSKYCSKKCLFDSGKWKKAKKYKCATCASEFVGKASRQDRAHQFCSKHCYQSYAPMQEERICAECGEAFQINKHLKNKTCSRKCRDIHYIRDNSPGWTGGLVLQNERRSRRIDREGYEAKYDGEHRLIAAREIGRTLIRGECIICLDGDNSNMNPDNLFLCPNLSELGLIQSGAVEWPTASNLKSFQISGYERPSVILTLHEWVNGQRRTSKRGKPITRHPQADEIIKRRRAGAPSRVLAKEFGCTMGTMTQTLKKRL